MRQAARRSSSSSRARRGESEPDELAERRYGDRSGIGGGERSGAAHSGIELRLRRRIGGHQRAGGAVSPLAGVNIDQIRDAMEAYRASNPGQGFRERAGCLGGGGGGGWWWWIWRWGRIWRRRRLRWRRWWDVAIFAASILRSRMALSTGLATPRCSMPNRLPLTLRSTARPSLSRRTGSNRFWSYLHERAVHSRI